MDDANQEEKRDEEPRAQPARSFSIWTGIALTIGLHSIQIPFAIATGGIAFFFIGLSQLLYMIPAFVWVLVKQKEPELAKGLAIGAAITFLLNATCFGIVFSMWS